MKQLLSALFCLFAAGFAAAQDAPLADPAEEARARALMRELRCVACENEPVSQSAAPIAEDMRVKVRELVAGGASDAEVLDWFEERYGPFVRFRPKAGGPGGLVLWTLPFALLLAGGGAVWLMRRQAPGAVKAVPPEDL